MKFRRKIQPCELVQITESESMRIDLAYARSDNLLFGERIYRKDAALWLYKDLAKIVDLAARQCFDQYGVRFVLYDGLRTVEAQEAMQRTQRARDNPQWMEEPRMLSLPGGGGHPRGMAVDVGLEGHNMGCPFDFMGKEAHRDYPHSEEVQKNRRILDSCMMGAAAELGIALFPLPQEWWDFRLLTAFYEQFAPLSEQHLPEPLRMMNM